MGDRHMDEPRRAQQERAAPRGAAEPPALQILREVPRRDGRALVFGEGAGGFSGWSKCKERIDARILASG